MPKERLDTLIHNRGLADSREQARRLVMAGSVLVNGQPATKPGHRVADDVDITLKSRPRFVSRGGEKLQGAVDAFELDVSDRVCMDIGASTGGFTDCLLQNGASRVYAIDVGRGQLDWRLRNDPRVVVMEGVNARYLADGDLPEKPSVATVDASFISLTKILPAAIQVLADEAQCIVLIKPQFEATRQDVGKGGVVRDPDVHEAVVRKVREFSETELKLTWGGVVTSPIKGPAGNIEFLARLMKTPGTGEDV
ncbi:MAG: TlyA family RNA methyltransferase [Candidatus Pacebacteria bacterium]|nr:TlyA family RNA methyltransferase [Candidatus Paceibacterota bacterium]